MKYSVIVPVYNCEKYLDSCIKSVFDQNTESDYEIILVNDGSVDASPAMCDRLAEEHECVRVIHQDNQGVSAARNAGIYAARGEYLLFLDADDLWRDDLLHQLDLATEKRPDVIQFGLQIFFENGHVEEYFPPVTMNNETGRDYLSRTLDQGNMLVSSSCINAHRKDFLMQNEIVFPVGITNGEDLLFRVREMGKAQSICSIDRALYLYRRNAESATRNVSLKRMQDIIDVLAEFYQQFPKPVIADSYCMSLTGIAHLSRKEAGVLQLLMEQNKGILEGVRGKKQQLVRLLFRLFGFYNGARIIKLLIQIKNR